jgi:hypothetical protein
MPAAKPLSERLNLDAESRAIIYQGASVNQLSQVFRMTSQDVARRIGDLAPVGIGRQNNPLYELRDAARRLIPIPITPEMIDAYMRRVNGRDLPAVLNKLYWEGKLSRDRYLERANELWFTEDISRVASESFQSLRMSIMLIPDVLREQADLSDRQFRVVQRIVDDALEGTRVRLIADLRKPDQAGPGLVEEDGPL